MYKPCLTIVLVLAVLLGLAAPCTAEPILVTVSGTWSTTGTSPVNEYADFSIQFQVDQMPTPGYDDDSSFGLSPVSFTYVNGPNTSYHTGHAGWYTPTAGVTGFDFRPYGWDDPSEYLQLWGQIPGSFYLDPLSSPTLVEMTVPVELTQAYFYPLGFSEEGSGVLSVTLTMLEETYSAVLVGGSGGESGGGSGESGGSAAVPEPGTMGAMLLALGAMAGMGFRRRKA